MTLVRSGGPAKQRKAVCRGALASTKSEGALSAKATGSESHVVFEMTQGHNCEMKVVKSVITYAVNINATTLPRLFDHLSYSKHLPFCGEYQSIMVVLSTEYDSAQQCVADIMGLTANLCHHNSLMVNSSQFPLCVELFVSTCKCVSGCDG